MRRRRCDASTRILFVAVAAAVASTACGSGSDSTTPGSSPAGSDRPAESSERCLVRLHGKGGNGATTVTSADENGDDIAVVSPTGNAEGWGGRQWLYFPEDEYEAALGIVDDAVAGCEQVIVNGFSNGGAFAAKLYCRGETFDGRLVGVVVDDPVVDAGVEGCTAAPSVDVALYWTGALDPPAAAGWECVEADWTCEGGRTIGIDAYAEAIDTAVLDSPNDEHSWFLDAPELSQWR